MVQLFQDFSPDPGNWGFGNNSENEFENRFGNGFENESANEFKNKFRNESSDPPPPEPSFENTRDSPLSFLMNLLTPEQRNTFNTCNELFAHALTPSTASADISQPLNQKGDLTNGTMDEPSCNEINRPSLIRLAAQQTQGKTGRNLAPVMLSLITNANRKGLRFTPEEVSLILEVLKEGKSPEEQAQIDRMMEMTRAVFRKHLG